METEDRMTLRDMPVDTRNYTIIDNITGKPIDQSSYTLNIDSAVIQKLNTLKKMNEEKIKQAALKDKYGDTSLVTTFTPDNNAVFTPVYNDEYIDYHDFNQGTPSSTDEEIPAEESAQSIEEPVETELLEETPQEQSGAEIIKADTLLDRGVARDPSVRIAEEEAKAAAEAEANAPKEELDYISNYTGDQTAPTEEEITNELQADNSLFTPELATLQQASEQIVNIDPNKLGEDIRPIKTSKRLEKIDLDKMEIISGKWIAWTAYILFFIPLLFRRKNRFVRLHANEGLELNIMEIIAGLLIAQYFLLPLWLTIEGTWALVSIIACAAGFGLALACVITIVLMAILSLAGKYNQTPWLWKKRIIKVSTERTSD